MPGQVVDTESAEEFMREAMTRVSEQDLDGVAGALERKSARFFELLAGSGAASLDRSGLRTVLRGVFATRRKADAILDAVGPDRLAAETDLLLHGPDPLAGRFERFAGTLVEFPEPALDLPSELLHFTYPDRYWLWTRWMWDPRTGTGSLPLVTTDDVELSGGGPGDTYLRVGEAVAFVEATGHAVGFTAIGGSRFGPDVFLACVYGVYMYTVLRLRMTQEFTQIVPGLPGLVRRLLGVHAQEA